MKAVLALNRGSTTEGVITVTPSWFRRLLGAKSRKGVVTCLPCRRYGSDRAVAWYWSITQSWVGRKIEREIETAVVSKLPRAEVKS